MKNAYHIKALVPSKNGGIECTLTKHLALAVATNFAAEYSTPESAAHHYRMYANRPDFPCLNGVRASHVWIEGPRGGIYNIETGKRYRNQ